MNDPITDEPRSTRLDHGIVVRVREDDCEIASAGALLTVRYAALFPSPRLERVSPGHLVAIAGLPGSTPAIVWRWYDAVVLGEQDDLVRLWEPAHGEVLARPRDAYAPVPPGARAYLSAGLPGAEWWVAGPALTSRTGTADVELDEVERLYSKNGLWEEI